MPVRAFRRFTVHPVLPERIAKLDALAKNLRWSWHQETRDLFRAIDPKLWEEVGEDPVKLLSAVRPERVQQLAADHVFARNVGLLHDDLVNYLSADLWFQRYAAENKGAPAGIGYFSAEYGVSFKGAALSDFNDQQDATAQKIQDTADEVKASGAVAIFAENSNNPKSWESSPATT